MIPCVWYVSKTIRPWERTLIGDMASALRAREASVTLYADGGTKGMELDEVQSWSALTAFERAGRVLLSGRALWHLWGRAPSWWWLIRLRFRTVHTSLDEDPIWRGHPTRLLREQALEGESLLAPTFESHVSRSQSPLLKDEDEAPAIYLGPGSVTNALKSALKNPLTRFGDVPIINLTGAHISPTSARSGVLVAGAGPSEALRSAALTMQGLTVIALRGSKRSRAGADSLEALLGAEGYFPVHEDSEGAWQDALEEALSDQGRQRAISARHHVKERYSAGRCADSLIETYSEALEGRSR